MPNIRLIVEYDGSGFHGWQKQGNLRTIQAELERVLKIVLRCDIGSLHAAGRTDAGVHARGQVVTFRIDHEPDLRRLIYAVSNILRPEVAIMSAEFVPESFHPGRSASKKQYSYSIINRDVPLVLERA